MDAVLRLTGKPVSAYAWAARKSKFSDTSFPISDT
jgi:hypothetical protein